MCALLAKLVRVEHVYATIFVDETMLAKTIKDTDKRFDLNKEQNLRNLIRYIYYFSVFPTRTMVVLSIIHVFSLRIVSLHGDKVPFEWDIIQGAFIEQYKKLHSGEPVPIAPGSDEKFEAIVAPQLILLDVSYHILAPQKETMI